jgi:hypothetical protein
MIEVGDLIVPADEMGAIVRSSPVSHFSNDDVYEWLPPRPALVLRVGSRVLPSSSGQSYVRKLWILLDGRTGWVNEIWVRKIEG